MPLFRTPRCAGMFRAPSPRRFEIWDHRRAEAGHAAGAQGYPAGLPLADRETLCHSPPMRCRGSRSLRRCVFRRRASGYHACTTDRANATSSFSRIPAARMNNRSKPRFQPEPSAPGSGMRTRATGARTRGARRPMASAFNWPRRVAPVGVRTRPGQQYCLFSVWPYAGEIPGIQRTETNSKYARLKPRP